MYYNTTTLAPCAVNVLIKLERLTIATIQVLQSRRGMNRAATVEGPTMQRAVAEAALVKDPSLPLLIPPKGVIARKLLDKWLAS